MRFTVGGMTLYRTIGTARVHIGIENQGALFFERSGAVLDVVATDGIKLFHGTVPLDAKFSEDGVPGEAWAIYTDDIPLLSAYLQVPGADEVTVILDNQDWVGFSRETGRKLLIPRSPKVAPKWRSRLSSVPPLAQVLIDPKVASSAFSSLQSAVVQLVVPANSDDPLRIVDKVGEMWVMPMKPPEPVATEPPEPEAPLAEFEGV